MKHPLLRGLLAAGAITCALAALPDWCFAADQSEKHFDLNLERGAVPAAQRTMRVQKGDVVHWRIRSDGPGELHLHAYRVVAKLAPGASTELTFRAYATGRFRLEWHAAPTLDKTTGQGAKPPDGAHHHAPPLATLEVRPE